MLERCLCCWTAGQDNQLASVSGALAAEPLSFVLVCLTAWMDFFSSFWISFDHLRTVWTERFLLTLGWGLNLALRGFSSRLWVRCMDYGVGYPRYPRYPRLLASRVKWIGFNRLRLDPARLGTQGSLGYLTFYFYKWAARPWNELHGDGHPMIRPPTTTAQRYPYYKSVASRKEVSAWGRGQSVLLIFRTTLKGIGIG